MPNTLQKKKPYWLAYYLLAFGIGAFALFAVMNLFDNTFIWGADGYYQYYPTAQYARTFWGTLLHGKLPMMDFTLGEGLDPIQTMMYYGLTEPLSLLYALVPQNGVHIMFGIITIFKMLLSGLAFGWYAKKHSDDDKSVAMGALVYVFSGFVILWIQAPTFLNAGYLFPILLHCMDVAFEKKKCTPLAIATCTAYITNYYVAAVISCMLLAYACIRICMDAKPIRQNIMRYSMIALSHLLGILAASVVLMPALMALINSTRGATSTGNATNLFYFPWQYYVDIIRSAFLPVTNTREYWNTPYQMQLNFLPIAAPALLMFLGHKTEKGSKQRRLKLALLVCSIFMLIPTFGRLFNGNAYTTHRWAFALAMVMGLITVWAVPRFAEMPKWVKWSTLGWFTLSVILTFFMTIPRAAIASTIIIAVVSALLLIKPRRLYAYAATVLAILCFLFNTFVAYPYGATFITNRVNEKVQGESYSAIVMTQDELDDFLRVSTIDSKTGTNIGVLIGQKTTTSVWNVMPAGIGNYTMAQNFPTASSLFWTLGADDRTSALTLAGVEYYVTTDSNMTIPYGFTLYDTVEKDYVKSSVTTEKITYYIYKNEYNPGIGYMYYNTLHVDVFNSLDIASKQLALMQYAVVDKQDANIGTNIMALELQSKLEITDEMAYLHVNIPDGYEVYLSIDEAVSNYNVTNIKFRHPSKWKASQQGMSGGSKTSNGYLNVVATDEHGNVLQKEIEPDMQNSHITTGSSKRTVNLGHKLCGDTVITLDYYNANVNMKGIKVYAYSLGSYRDQVESLIAHSWSDVKYSNVTDGTNFISGKIHTASDGVFQLAIPYNTGWKAFVDGKEVEVFCSGVKYMGINLKSGTHDIRFEYTTPGLFAGAITSIISILLVAAWFLIEFRKELKWLITESKFASACKYVITGCCTTATDFVLYILMVNVGMIIPLSKLISCVITTIMSFIINRNWSFSAKNGKATSQAWKFIISQVLNIGANVLTNSLVLEICDIKLIAFVAATFVGMCISFTLQQFWVFRKKEVPTIENIDCHSVL